MEPFDYRTKRVVVTGCSSGVGLALSEALHKRGAEVIGMSRRRPCVDMAAFHEIDLRSETSIKSAARLIRGEIDALFNCAGAPPTMTSLDIVKINFLGTRLLTDLLLDRMGPGSAIANISSSSAAGWRSNIDHVHPFLSTETFEQGVAWYMDHETETGHGYLFSKQAITAWTLRKAVELAARGIRINSTSPGPIETPLLDAARAAFPPELLDDNIYPSGRNSTVDEQVLPLLFLNGDGASYINGADLPVDGGYTAAHSVVAEPHAIRNSST